MIPRYEIEVETPECGECGGIFKLKALDAPVRLLPNDDVCLHRDVERLEAELASWRRVAERLQAEKLAAAVPLSVPAHPPLSCVWRLEDPDGNAYQTACGEMFEFNVGTPAENKAKFCQYCGKPLVVAPVEEEDNCEPPTVNNEVI